MSEATPRPSPGPSSLGTSDGQDPAVEEVLRALDEAAAGDDPQQQIDAARRVYEVLQSRLSGVTGS
ncbi:hypothetical protein [Arsenicicoccus sp. oral taxon 190]|uniref:hypothetical protein n=1 Tax=Arsenicicoccus sp. oral taxon 190 TaxID=1658671 RepID=UPI00067A0EE1|nr:hypothetical protein [Arsenicicoccus sp. oral taxon 190]AKT51679.1 hypothetical protein ADJ73_10985 [Arsenicicoccus sp. oral taxon 190]